MRFLQRFTSVDLLYIAIFSALGLAIKPLITPLIHLVSAPMMIPGGSFAGGLYMMWLALIVAVVNKPGAALTLGFVQAVVILSLGFFGNHGAVSLISYTLPGIAAEIVALPFRNYQKPDPHILICVSANITGTLVVIFLVMRLALIPALISISAATLSGILGGIVSSALYRKMIKFNLI